MIEVKTANDADILLKTTQFDKIKIKTYPHQLLNSSKRVINISDLSLCSSEEIKNGALLKYQGITDIKNIQILRNGTLIDTNTYILNVFNNSMPPKEIRRSYIITKVELYLPNFRRYHHCQRFSHLQKQYVAAAETRK